MKAASLGHQYLTVKSLNKDDNYFRGPRSRSLPKSEIQNHPLNSAIDPLSHRSNIIDETSEPSVTAFTRSISDTTDPHVIYKSAPIKEGNDRQFDEDQ
jgi:hypothetical protein